MTRLVVVLPLTPLAEGDSFAVSEWPLHVTVLPPAFTGSGFRPHITVKTHARVHEGDEFTLEQLAVVDMAPRSSPGRPVLATIALSVDD